MTDAGGGTLRMPSVFSFYRPPEVFQFWGDVGEDEEVLKHSTGEDYMD
jgi:hypothetical protein